MGASFMGDALRNPSLLGTLVGTASGLFWSLAYVLIVLRAKKDKDYGMPFAAMCFNLIWEFIYTFVFPPQGQGIQFWIPLLINFLWFALDVVIVITWLLYWRASSPPGLSPKWHLPALALGLVSATAVLFGIQYQFNDPPCVPSTVPAGGVSSFLQNLMMSALFIGMALRRNSLSGQSVPIALSKLLGTALASVYFYFFIPGATTFYWIVLFVLIFVYDSIYTVLLLRIRGKPLTA
jgi:hypothetical protein